MKFREIAFACHEGVALGDDAELRGSTDQDGGADPEGLGDSLLYAGCDLPCIASASTEDDIADLDVGHNIFEAQ